MTSKTQARFADTEQARSTAFQHVSAGENLTTGNQSRMCETVASIRSLDDLRAYIHHTLCEKENLVADQFTMTEMQLSRRARACGLQFSLHGPRNVRLGAIWVSDHNTIYFYDARGVRYKKTRLPHRLLPAAKAA